ncbi:NUDIX domain-containing protein [Candidatus Parcubacteria bacterium]|nr:MAG: NUDIX domain-containing protein [Candidatus Parcubacteria bacterium]
MPTPKQFTVSCYVLDQGRVLLQRQEEIFPHWLWDAPGSEVEEGQSKEAAMIEYLGKVADIGPRDYKLMAELDIVFERRPDLNHYRYVYVAPRFGGLVPSDNKRVRWFDIKGLPWDDMCPADRYWLPAVLRQNYFVKLRLFFGPEGQFLRLENLK